jgi:uncharacterized protein YndB with AHSA1/START domain
VNTTSAPPADEVTVHVAASPEDVWDMVSDVTRMGEWSPECFRCRWYGSPKGPEAGARFVGFNRASWRIWATPNVVVEAERGRIFSWRTLANGNIWAYRMEPDGEGALVTESRQLPAKRPWYGKLLLDMFFGGTAKHDTRMREGMRQTLERLKAVAEAR